MSRPTCSPALALLLGGLFGLTAWAQPVPVDRLALRYGVQVNPLAYPQATPEEALKSVARALERGQFDYLVAQLADPRLVDERVAEYRDAQAAGSDQAKTFLAFDRLVRATGEHFANDPHLLRELRLLARDAQWETAEAEATGTAKAVPDHKIVLRRVGQRWFLENRQQ